MGAGRCDSRHWDPERKLTDNERATFWEQKAMQYKGEMFVADQTLEKYALRIAKLERQLAEYRLAFGPMAFHTPNYPDDKGEHQ